MRTTFNAINRHTQFVIGDRYNDLGNIQKKIATGKELSRPSDDPVGISNILNLRSSNIALKQFERNTDDGLSWMEITDTTMMSMNTILQRGRELAIQGDSDTLSRTERVYIAEEVQQLTRQLISLSNSKFKGDYIFAGSHTDKPPVPMAASNADTTQSYTGYKMSYVEGAGAVIGTTLQIYSPRGSAVTGDREAVSNMIPGTFSLKVGPVNAVNPTILTEGTDFSVDYLNGKVTILSAAAQTALAHDFRPIDPENPADALRTDEYGSGLGANNIQMEFEYASQSRDIYGKAINTDSPIYREIEAGVKVQINTGFQGFTVNNSTNMITSMIQLGESLLVNNQVGIRGAMDNIDISFNRILSAQSENGAKVNLFNTTRDRNDNQQVETTRLQAELEDADFAETVSQYTIAQTVFNAALQSTAKIMQSSLANYL